MNALGKRSRKLYGGNRYAVRKANKQTKRGAKKFADAVQTPEGVRTEKAQHRKALSEK